MPNYLIEQLRNEIAYDGIKQSLKKLQSILRGSHLSDQIIIINNRFNYIESDNRIGVLGYNEYLTEKAKVLKSILSIVNEIEADIELMSLLRKREKAAFYAEYVKIVIDYSEFIIDKKINYIANQFLNIDDFLNEVYFEISKFVPPGSFRKKWELKRQTDHLKNLTTNEYNYINYSQDIGSELSDNEIESILNKVYPFGEALYRKDEIEKIYLLNDELIKVIRI